MTFDSTLRFNQTPLISVDGVSTYGRWVVPSVVKTGSFVEMVVQSGMAGRPDLISNAAYGTPDFYWLIIAYNSPRQPLNWPKRGEIIRIPSPEAVATIA